VSIHHADGQQEVPVEQEGLWKLSAAKLPRPGQHLSAIPKSLEDDPYDAVDTYYYEPQEFDISPEELKRNHELNVYEWGRFVADMQLWADDAVRTLNRRLPTCVQQNLSVSSYLECAAKERETLKRVQGEVDAINTAFSKAFDHSKILGDRKMRSAIAGKWGEFLVRMGDPCWASNLLREVFDEQLVATEADVVVPTVALASGAGGPPNAATNTHQPDPLVLARFSDQSAGCQIKMAGEAERRIGADPVPPPEEWQQENLLKSLVRVIETFRETPRDLKSQGGKLIGSVMTIVEFYPRKDPSIKRNLGEAAKIVEKNRALHDSLQAFDDFLLKPLCGKVSALGNNKSSIIRKLDEMNRLRSDFSRCSRQ